MMITHSNRFLPWTSRRLRPLGSFLGILAAAGWLSLESAWAQEVPASEDQISRAKAVFERSSGAIVNVYALVDLHVNAGGSRKGNEDRPINTIATVIDPKGLAVASNMVLDPSVSLNGGNMVDEKGARRVLKASAKFKTLRFVFENGDLVPARVVYVDRMRDLMFLAPALSDNPKNPENWPHVDFGATSLAEVADPVCMLHRQTEVLSLAPALSFRTVESVVDQPYRVYTSTSLVPGALLTSLDGKAIGIVAGKIKAGYAPVPVAVAASEIIPLIEKATEAATKPGHVAGPGAASAARTVPSSSARKATQTPGATTPAAPESDPASKDENGAGEQP